MIYVALTVDNKCMDYFCVKVVYIYTYISGFPKYYVFMGGPLTSYEGGQIGGDKKFVGGGTLA